MKNNPKAAVSAAKLEALVSPALEVLIQDHGYTRGELDDLVDQAFHNVATEGAPADPFPGLGDGGR